MKEKKKKIGRGNVPRKGKEKKKKRRKKLAEATCPRKGKKNGRGNMPRKGKEKKKFAETMCKYTWAFSSIK